MQFTYFRQTIPLTMYVSSSKCKTTLQQQLSSSRNSSLEQNYTKILQLD